METLPGLYYGWLISWLSRVRAAIVTNDVDMKAPGVTSCTSDRGHAHIDRRSVFPRASRSDQRNYQIVDDKEQLLPFTRILCGRIADQ